MNIINININFKKGENKLMGIPVITGDYGSTKLHFYFDRSDGTKVFELKNPLGEIRYLGEIIDNEIVLTGVDDGVNYSIFNVAGLYTYEVSLYSGDSKLTSVSGHLPVKQEQVIIDDRIVEPYVPIFDDLMQDVETRLESVDTALETIQNLDITAEKVGSTATITITHQDGTETEVEIYDGAKGDKGEQGERGLKGDKGDTGEQGPQGIQGEQGIQGPQGDKGDKGDKGVKGDTGATGPKGEQGPQGERGPAGTNGTDGEDGFSPIANVTKSGKVVTITITDKNGTTTETVSDADLTGYVQNTDYASDSTGGVIKTDWGTGTYMSNGKIQARSADYTTYGALGNTCFISKGTLESVLDEKIGNIETLLSEV